MLLRNSFSNTKKFFQKTVNNVKSFLSKGSSYERLPKTAEINGEIDIETGCKDLDSFYVEFTNQWDSHKNKMKNNVVEKKSKKSREFLKNPPQIKQHYVNSARIEAKENMEPVKFNQKHEFYPLQHVEEPEKSSPVSKQRDATDVVVKNKSLEVRKPVNFSDLCSKSVRERRLSSIASKLKDFELMDKGNVDHKRDVEEVLYYYARLTCPAYIDIVDKFFMEICTEFCGSNQVTPQINSLRPKLQELKM